MVPKCIRKNFGRAICLLSLLFLTFNCITAEDTYTSNLSLRLPEVGVEDPTTPWGTKINNNFTILDSAVGGVYTDYFKLSGISGGQTAIGGTDAGDDLIFRTTSNASKGSYIFSELTTGILKSTSGTISIITDSSTNWDTAYTHSQLTSGNPHSVTQTEVGLANVENTALSTWAGSGNITTLGTVTSGTLSTGASLADVTMSLGSDADGDIYYRASNKLTRLAKGSANQTLTMNPAATAPVWTTPAETVVLTDYIGGMDLENDSGDTDHDIKINTGLAANSDNDLYINLSSALVKQIDVNWAAGTGNGGFPSGLTLTADTTYHFFVIVDNDTGTEDACFDSSLTAANCLADATAYDDYRRVGSVLTDPSSNIHQFIQFENKFLLKTPILTFNGPGSLTGNLKTIATPLGIKTIALLNVTGNQSGSMVYLSNPDMVDLAPSDNVSPLINAYGDATAGSGSVDRIGGQCQVLTNTLSQIRERSASTNNLAIAVYGWIDVRK